MGYNQYNLNEKSLYNLFSQYDRTLIDIIIDSFKKEKVAPNLLRKQFGVSFDGENLSSFNQLDYMEKSTLEGILSRFESRLKVAKYLSKTHNNNEIYNFFSGKTDVEIYQMTKEYLKEIESDILKETFDRVDTILSKYSITKEELKEIIDSITNIKGKIIILNYYSLSHNKSIEEICESLRIDNQEYDSILEQAKKQLHFLLEKKMSNNTKTEKTKAKVKIAKKEDKSLTKEEEKQIFIENSKQLLEKNKNVDKLNQNKKSTETSEKNSMSFYDIFLEGNKTSEKKQIIKDLIDKFIIDNPDEAITVIKKMYSDDLSYRTNYIPSIEENLKVIDYKKKIRPYLKDNIKKVELLLKPSFFDYFIDSNMSSEEKDDITRKILIQMDEIDINDKKVILSIYEQDLNSLKTEQIDKLKKHILFKIIDTMKKEIKKVSIENQKIIRPSFYDYFLNPNLTTREEKQIREKVKEIVTNSKSKSSEIITKLYTESLDNYTGYIMTLSEQKLFYTYKDKIKTSIKVSSLAKEFKASFYDYFITDNMSLNEKQELKKEIDKILLKISKKHIDFLYSIYGEDLSELKIYNLEPKQKEELSKIILIFNNYLDIKINPSQKEITKKPKTRINGLRKNFYDYFINEDTKEDKKTIKKAIDDYIKKSNNKGVTLLKKIYDDDFNLIGGITTRQEQVYLNNLVESIKISLSSRSTLYLPNTIFDTFLSKEIDLVTYNKEKEKITRIITNLKEQEKYIIYKIYGRSLKEKNLFILSLEEKRDYKLIIKRLKEEIKNTTIVIENEKEIKKDFILKNHYTDDQIRNRKLDLLFFRKLYESDSKNAKNFLKMYGNLLNENNSSKLTKEEIKKCKMYINQLIYILKNKEIDKYHNLCFKTVFYIEKEQYRQEIDNILKDYLNNISIYKKGLLVKAYGQDLNVIRNVKLTDKEREELISIYYYLFNKIKEVTSKEYQMEDKETNESNNKQDSLLSNFFDYFIKIDLDENEKRIKKAKIMLCINKMSDFRKGIINKIYGPNFDTLCVNNISESDKKELDNIITLINNYLYRNEVQKKVNNYKFSLFDYFINPDMTEEQKEKIKKKVIEFYQCSNSLGNDLAKKMYTDTLDFYTPFQLTDSEHKVFNSYIKSIEKYIESNKKPYNFNPKSFYDYFDDKDKLRVRMYLESTRSKAKEIIKNVYGVDYDNLTDYPITKEERKEMLSFIKTIKRTFKTSIKPISFYDYFMEPRLNTDNREILKQKIKSYIESDLKEYKDLLIKLYGVNYDSLTNSIFTEQDIENIKIVRDKIKKQLKVQPIHQKLPLYLPSFYDYFPKYKESSHKEQIKLYLERSNSLGKEIVNKLYKDDYNTYTGFILAEKKDIVQFRGIINNIKTYLKNEKKIDKPKEKNKPSVALNVSFYRYFINSDMSKETKEKITKIVKEYLDSSQNKTKELIINGYGKDYNSYNGYKYSTEDYKKIHIYIYVIKKHIKGYDLREQKKPTSFFDKFITSDMSVEEQDRIKDYIVNYIDSSTEENKKAVKLLYGENYDTYTDIKDYEARKKCRILFYNLKHSLEYTKKSEIAIKEPQSPMKIDIYSLVPNAHLIMNNDLIDINIVKKLIENDTIIELYEQYYDSNKLLEVLKISKSSLISIYLKYLDKFTDISEIITFIINNTNDISIIQNILSYSIFSNITDKEKELLYLKLLQLKDNNITNEVISTITGLSIKDIEEYRIISQNDQLNSINKILKIKRN